MDVAPSRFRGGTGSPVRIKIPEVKRKVKRKFARTFNYCEPLDRVPTSTMGPGQDWRARSEQRRAFDSLRVNNR